MENVLYDIYLADASIEQDYRTFGNNLLRKQNLYQTVFEKHHTNIEQFDTSLVWYSSHLMDFLKIHDNINKRYQILLNTLSEETLRQAALLEQLSLENLWKGDSIFFLTDVLMMNNRFYFRIDTTHFDPGDTYELRFNILGINRLIPALVQLRAQLGDTVKTVKTSLQRSGPCFLTLSLPPNQFPRSLFGFIELQNKDNRSLVLVNNFCVYRRKSSVASLQKEQTQFQIHHTPLQRTK